MQEEVADQGQEEYAVPGGLDKKKKRKKRKSGRRPGGQHLDSPEAPPSSDQAAIDKYKEEYEAYFLREYGDIYLQAKAAGQLGHLFN